MQIPLDSAACNGLSRRSFFRYAAGASALASAPILTEAHLAMAQPAHILPTQTRASILTRMRNPLGPSDAARQAMIDIVPCAAGRYLMNMQERGS